MNSIKVSVITPSYNQGAFLEETIQSVLSQSYDNIEYIIIDGGSTDNSVNIIKRYTDHLAYWCSEKDNGQADAINKGFKHATGSLLCWINSDDILYPTFVEERVQQFIQHPEADMIYGDVEQGDSPAHKFVRRGAPVTYVDMLLTLNVPIPQQSAMWKRTILDRIGYLQPQWYVLLDREFFMRMAESGIILYREGALAFFRNHEQSKSIKDWGRWATELECYYVHLFENEHSPFYHYKRQAMTSLYLHCYKIARDCSMNREARRYFRQASALNLCRTVWTVVVDELHRIKHHKH